MYISLRNRPAEPASEPRLRGRRRIPATVWLLGTTSLLTDISSEMITAVLPIFLTLQLGLSPAQFGLVDGLYRGGSAVSRLAAGVLADRFARPKLVASVGYGLSALTRPLLLVAGSVTSVAALVSVDRVGKGIRTAPRDAMIAGASSRRSLAGNFGVHRAMDNVGAMLGPLVAFGLLLLLPGNFDAVFVVSAAFAVLGFTVIAVLVRDRPRAPTRLQAQTRLQKADVVALLRSRRFVGRVALAGLLTIFTVSDGFIFLSLLQRDADLARVFPLFAVGLALSYAALAVPVGRLADRVGRSRVYVAGHVVLIAVYAVVGSSVGALPAVAVTLLLMGLFYAATDGVLAAVVSSVVPEVSRASGLALAQTVVAIAAFASSVVFGLLLGVLGPGLAYLLMGVGLLSGVLVAAWMLGWGASRTALTTR